MGEAAGLHGLQMVFLLLLVLVAAFAVMAERVRLPYPIVLVVAGLGISFVPHMPRVPLSPQLVFVIFLPPLLYYSAWNTSWREFQNNLISITLLAIGLVAFTVMGVALVSDHFITALDFKSGFVLGAVVATTDAIAAASIAARIGLPARVVEILEGESLLNDATGLLALEFGVQMLQTGETPTVGAGVLRLLWLMAGGIGAGLVVGWVVAIFERWIDDGPVEMVISVVVPYVAYLAGEELRVSGVMAVVACGLYLGRRSAGLFSPEVRLLVTSGWESLNFLLNGLVFLLIGLQLPYVLAGIEGYSGRTLVEYGAVFSGVLIALRLVWIFPAARLSNWLRRIIPGIKEEPMPGAKGVFVIGWTGMRGVLALAAAFSLPEVLPGGRPFTQRNLIIFLTFAVILVTLVVQGLSLPWLIRRLGLGRTESREEEMEARRTVLETAISYLEAQQKDGGEELAHGFEDLLHRYRHRLEAANYGLSGEDADTAGERTYRRVREISREAAQVERRTAVRLRDDGKIGDGVMNRLLTELDLTEARQKVEG